MAEVRDVTEDAEWVWADPIPDCFKVSTDIRDGNTAILLRCERCGERLYTVGEIDLWELALDAKRHALNECQPPRDTVSGPNRNGGGDVA